LPLNEQLVEEYKRFHSENENHYWGDMLRHNSRQIEKLIKETESKTLLDYGCGKGLQYFVDNEHKNWGVMPTLYDPGIEKFSTLPDNLFDGVISTDVMEHIPECDIQETLGWIFKRARLFVFLAISTRPAVTILPNGENAHCTVQPIEWWHEQIMNANTDNIYAHLKTYGNSNGYRMYNLPRKIFIERLTI
tara:strand:- start:700 stop:1272 length:573 start_codon:yes stop_codon:yes gene_type:complete